MKQLILKFDKELYINHRLLFDLNDMLRMASSHWGKLQKEKNKAMMVLGRIARTQNKDNVYFDTKCKINFIFMESYKSTGRERDFDNITGAGHKVILDTLQMVKILKGDDRNIVAQITDKVFYQCSKSRIIVKITELSDEEIKQMEEEKEIFENVE